MAGLDAADLEPQVNWKLKAPLAIGLIAAGFAFVFWRFAEAGVLYGPEGFMASCVLSLWTGAVVAALFWRDGGRHAQWRARQAVVAQRQERQECHAACVAAGFTPQQAEAVYAVVAKRSAPRA